MKDEDGRLFTTPVSVLRLPVHPYEREDALKRIILWAEEFQTRAIFFAPVHTVMECFYKPDFCALAKRAHMILADGQPVVWALRKLGFSQQQRLDGSGMMLSLCRLAARKGLPVALYGGHPQWLASLQEKLCQHAPGLKIALAIAPPFRKSSKQEHQDFLAQLEASGAQMLFVGLGCPKQERWMVEQLEAVKMPMLGVGAAFDFLSERKARAPRIWQVLGCEWLFRLLSEPRRLWKRYLFYNTAFLWHTCLLSTKRLKFYQSGS